MTQLTDRPATTLGGAGERLDDTQVRQFVAESLAGLDLDGRSLCLIVPDGTRSCPLPLFVDAIHTAVHERVSALTAVVALGTHQGMTEDELAHWFGYEPGELEARYPGLRVRNHEWWDPATLASVGEISAERVRELSDGRLAEAVTVTINREVLEHDVALVVGPVFPHEVVGFSGGNKYFFPGVAGPEIIDISHWLGALITSVAIIGTPGITPVRALIDDAAALIPVEKAALCMVVESGSTTLHSMSFGSPATAWAAAAEVSAQTHIRYLDEPVRRAVAVMPAKYQDMWTAAKGFYKLEPVVADGGEVVIYAPHIRSLAQMHPEIADIGYHTRDYFLHHWDDHRHVHWGVLAHSTHLRGAGVYDPVTGERPRVTVTLATGVDEATVRRAGLDYLDPASVDLEAEARREDTLVVPNAGETLFRLR